MSPAEEAAELLEQFGIASGGRAGELLADRRQRDRAGGDRRSRRGLRARRSGIPANGARSRRRGAASWCGCSATNCARAKEPLAQAGHARSRQDRPGEPRRSPGDDRHLRLRGRPVAPALRPDHRQRAAGPPDDGAMASARAGAGDQRVQFPGRGMGVERRAGAGVRRSGDLEAEREDAALRRSGDGAGAPRAGAVRRCAGGAGPARPGRPRDRRGAGRRSAHRAGLGDRIDRDGPRGRPARRAALRPGAARARRQQCDDRLPERGPRPGRAGDPVLGRRDGGPALHHAAAPDRPRQRRRPAGRAAQAAVRAGEGRRPARARHPDRAADRRGGVRSAWNAVLGDGIERVDAVPGGFYVRPAIVEVDAHEGTVLQETFAPILYVLRYRDLDEAIAIHNAVPQGLSSSIFTTDLREAERFISAAGPTAASPTSTSARRAPRSAARSAARRRPAAGAKAARTAGAPTCGARPTPSITASDLPLAQGIRFDVAP